MGCFPEAWKKDKLVATDSSSMRPITLLPELGNAFGRIIKKHLERTIGTAPLHHENQYGFCKDKNTTQAIETLLNAVNTHDCKYVAALSMDICEAFDNLWWPATIIFLQDIGMPNKLVRIVRNCLHNRDYLRNQKH